jgi:type II secretory ATPase GspE/PulE/Tfp pilus assembly ATPase PilB-like protein
MNGLAVTEQELRTLLVSDLEVLSVDEFDRARSLAQSRRMPLERAAAERARVPFAFLLQEVARSWGVAYMDLKVSDVRRDALRLLREEFARQRQCVAYARGPHEVHVAMANPRDKETIREIARTTGLEVRPRLTTLPAIRRAQLLYRTELFALLNRSTDLDQSASGAEVGEVKTADVLTRILEYAVVSGASDIHIEPFEFDAIVRYRVDGVLHEVLTLTPVASQSLVTRIKVLGGMRVDERRAPQDGRFDADLSGVAIDLRVSSLPTMWGEKVVMRVLSRDAVLLDLESVGFVPADYELVTSYLTRPHGMILVTGPTGSGKTSTLYAFLMRVGAERRNVVNLSTIEDPIEYTMPRVNQVSVNVPAGVDFAAGLRALLRQDPDIIMVGEIRDKETADTAVRSALVGRLLFSTLHTNDATSAVARMLDMGVEPYLLASTLTLVVAQRLVRRLCPSCRESYQPDPAVVLSIEARADFEHIVRGLREYGVLRPGDERLSALRFFRSTGCTDCRQTGYRGRLGIFELFQVNDDVRPLIMERRETSAIREAAVAAGMRTLLVDGLAKAIMGETAIEEVLRAAI